jgi:hypothetical protein
MARSSRFTIDARYDQVFLASPGGRLWRCMRRVPTTSVRYNAILHDFMMLNPLRETEATTAAIEQAIRTLRKALGTGR